MAAEGKPAGPYVNDFESGISQEERESHQAIAPPSFTHPFWLMSDPKCHEIVNMFHRNEVKEIIKGTVNLELQIC